MRFFGRALLVIVLIAGAVEALYWWKSTHPSTETQTAPVTPVISPIPSSTVSPSPSPSILYPIPTSAESEYSTKALPSVDESDDSLHAALSGLFGEKAFESLFIPNHIVRRIVVTVNNANHHEQTSAEFLPLKSPGGSFEVIHQRGKTWVAPSNSKRYRPYVLLLQNLDLKKAASVYTRFYPLFQSAYQDLGRPGYFNDRVIAAIDRLLATPEISDPKIEVTRPSPHNRYKYVDNRLEALTSTQKVLIRMGVTNEKIIKSKLRELRGLLIGDRQ